MGRMSTFLRYLRRFPTLMRLSPATPDTTPSRQETTDPEIPDGLDVPRYEACTLLLNARTPFLIWGEDALAFFGVPTILFDLFLIVENIDQAARVLETSGYIKTRPNPRFSDIGAFSNGVPRLVRPAYIKVMESHSSLESASDLPHANDMVMSGVVLLPAGDWDIELQQTMRSIRESIVSSSWYFDTMVAKYLTAPEGEEDGLRRHLAIHMTYYVLYVEEVWSVYFEEDIRKEHRQILYDLLANGSEGVRADFQETDCQKYHQAIRDLILEGTHHVKSIATLPKRATGDEPEVGIRVVITL